MRRPAIPQPLKRAVLIEAGHRCAIPTCGQTTTEIAHIVPWKEGREHTFDNLIALCPTCHTRFDKGEIDRKAMRQYKANLSILTGRYGDLEQRVLRLFAQEPEAKEFWLPGGHDILLMYLLDDGLLTDAGQFSGVIIAGIPSQRLYRLTDKGRVFIDKWLSATRLE